MDKNRCGVTVQSRGRDPSEVFSLGWRTGYKREVTLTEGEICGVEDLEKRSISFLEKFTYESIEKDDFLTHSDRILNQLFD